MSERSYFSYVLRFLRSKDSVIFIILFAVVWIFLEVALHFNWVSGAVISRLGLGGGMLGSALFFLFQEWQGDSKESEKVDQENFRTFLNLFPSNGAMRTFETHYFEKDFPRIIFEEINKGAAFYSEPGRAFLNQELHEDVFRFLDSLNGAVEKLSSYTSPVDADFSGFPPELVMFDESLFKTRASELNRLTTETSRIYRSLLEKWVKQLKLRHL